MTRPTRRPLLQMRESFEITRFSPECLIEAYRCIVPAGTKAIRPAVRHSSPLPSSHPKSREVTMPDHRIALYARVSAEQQARDHTIASQVAALHERIAADQQSLAPDDAYVDEGYSGSVLVRPGLERLRDAVAPSEIEPVYVLAPDRLARHYAHQVLLMEEFRRAGCDLSQPCHRGHRRG